MRDLFRSSESSILTFHWGILAFLYAAAILVFLICIYAMLKVFIDFF